MKLNKINYLSIAVLSLLASQTFAGGIERSPQAIDALFESGTYAEIAYTHARPDIQGTDTDGNHVPDIAENTESMSYAVKTDITPSLRLAVLYDEPYGAKATFEGQNNFVATNFPEGDTSTTAEVNTKNITALLGYNLNKNFMIYGGPAIQEFDAKARIRGAGYKLFSGYNIGFDETGLGWVAGMSYAKPELGILASLTYRSEIDHKGTYHEDVPLADMIGYDYEHTNTGKLTTPDSVNLNLQTGLNPTTALYAKVRWVSWGSFAIYPPILQATTAQLGAAGGKGLPFVAFNDDSTQVEVGIGKRLTPKLAMSVSGSWDSGTGEPAPTLGPVKGYWGAGLAGKYNFNQNIALSLGGRYVWFGDAMAASTDGRTQGYFKDNNALVVGMKLSYKSK